LSTALINVLGAELIRATIEVACEVLYGSDVGTHGRWRVVSPIEFLDHQLAKIRHYNLLGGGYSRSDDHR
jgi:hypothetical protein